MKYCLSIVLLLGGFSCFGQEENYDTVKIVAVRVTPNIYMLKGSDAGNIGVFTGPEGILLIDDKYAPLSNKIKQAIEQIDRGTMRFLINTHVHMDHSGGNANFRKWGLTVVAHDHVRDRMMEERMDGENHVLPPREKEAWPVITFPDRLNFHFNDEEIELLHFGKGHTDGDVIVHFKNANVFHTGDMFVRYGYPYIDVKAGGGFNEFVDFLDKLIPLMNDQSKVIPGHGELATKSDVIAFRDKLKDIRDQVSIAMKKGMKPADTPSLPIASKYDSEWGHGFLKGKDFVLMMAEDIQLKGKK